MKKKNAAGTEGCLLIYPDMSTAVDTGRKNRHGQKIVECSRDIVKFRVYERDGEGNCMRDSDGHVIFKDYDIHHHDLRVKLLDGVIIEDGDKHYIDYDLS